MGIKIGMCGVGNFGPSFVLLFKHHPDVDELLLCDADGPRLEAAAARFGIQRTFSSLDALCESDVDAIALFTPRHTHGPQAIQALEAGKHVYSAVPPAIELATLERLVATVEGSGLTYMSGETSLYYPWTLYCKQRYEAGDMGRFVYAESQYLHDLGHYSVFERYLQTGDERFKRESGLPPMYYPTHSVSMPLAVTGAHVTSVTCLGVEDKESDGVFGVGANEWDNSFSNQVALMRTSDGGALRANEMRRIGWRSWFSVYMSFFGTEGSYEQSARSATWLTKDTDQWQDLLPLLTPGPSETVAGALGEEPRKAKADEFTGVSPVHPVDRLPETYRGLPNGHNGSHAFLVHDFVSSVISGATPPGNIWDSANWIAAGLLAHESAKRDGERLDVPQFGERSSRGAAVGSP